MSQTISDRDGRRCFATHVGTAAGLALLACAPQGKEAPPLHVVATVPPLAGIVDRVAPGLAEVTVLIPPGASPVTYEPSLATVREAARAQVYVSVGHPAFAWEAAWLPDLLSDSRARLISGADGCQVRPDDPHVWLSFSCARNMAEGIARAVTEARPEFADSIASALAAFLADLDDVAEHADRALEPHRGGSFVVLHPAWGYLASAHGIEQVAILEHGSGDAGPGELAAIVERARRLGVRNVIVQPQFSAGPARLVASELGGDTVTLDPLGRDVVLTLLTAIDVLAEQVSP